MATRRLFIKSAVSASLLLSAGLSRPRIAAAAWPEHAFSPTTVEAAVAALIGHKEVINSDQITLKAPNLAENGSVVPITISSTLPDVETIAVFVAKNPVPLVANFELAPNTEAFVTARLKMAETSDVIVIIKADGRYYTQRTMVEVIIGGCGG